MAQKAQNAPKNAKKQKGEFRKSSKVPTEYQKERAALKRKRKGQNSVSLEA